RDDLVTGVQTCALPILTQLAAKGFVYERDGGRWLRSTDFGDQRDCVLVRSDGSTTYLCNDLAYHRDKFRRDFTHLIDIWGADHQIGTASCRDRQKKPEA